MAILQSNINDNWEVCATWESEWHLAQPLENGGDNLRRVTPWIPAQVPGVVQDDAWRAGLIPDPYRDRNSLACEWTAHRDWVYRRFIPKDFFPSDAYYYRIRFAGVDDRCTIFWDGRALMQHQGPNEGFAAYIPHPLEDSRGHWLHVLVRSAPKEYGQLGRTSEVSTRKTRFAYKWDFSTCLVPLGIWKPVSLDASSDGSFIDTPDVRATVDPRGELGKISIESRVHLHPGATEQEQSIALNLRILAPDRSSVASHELAAPPEGLVQCGLDVPRPALWFPHTLGSSPLYHLEMISPATAPAPRGWHSWVYNLETGFIHVALEKNPGAPDDALPYTFVINQQTLYICGANWVPADQLYGRPDRERMECILQMARQAKINLLRVWGGGHVEHDAFYQVCSRLGILVWHDFFQSSSGIDNEPSRDLRALADLAHESEAVVREVSRYACLANWCGGNELMDAGTSKPCTSESSPAIKMLERLAGRLDPGRPFFATTPSGPNFGLSHDSIEKSLRLDDAHGPWTFQGPVDHFRVHNGNTALFHSEYGVEGPPELESLLEITDLERLWPPDHTNRVWDFHGAWWANRDRVEAVFGPVTTLEQYLACAWHLQYSGLRYATEADRRRRPNCSGSAVWQLNEPWPNTCCTNLIDYFCRPKPGLYAIQKAYAPAVVTARMSGWSGTAPGTLPDIQIFFDRFTRSSTVDDHLYARLYAPSGALLHEQEVKIPSHSSPHATVFKPDCRLPESVCLLRLSLRKSGFRNEYLIGTAGLPPLAPIGTMEKTALSAQRSSPDSVRVQNASRTISFGIHLSAVRESGKPEPDLFSDNHFNLLPGESRIIQCSAGFDGPIRVQGLNVQSAVWAS
jgi:beta-mannosidase